MKKNHAFFTGISILSFAAIVGSVVPITHDKIFGVIASDDCEWNHYAQVNPSFTASGHRAYWVCCKHHDIVFEEPTTGTITNKTDDEMIGTFDQNHKAYLPPLSTTYYSKTATRSSGVLTEKWTLRDTTNGDFVYSLKSGNNGGFATVFDNSSTGKNLFPYEFNEYFDGIEMSFDGVNTTTLNITKEGGLVLEDVNFSFQSNQVTTVKITGEPLTIIEHNNSRDCFAVPGGGGTDKAFGSLVIDNDTKIIYQGDSTSTFAGYSGGNIKVNEGKKLTILGFNYGIDLNWKANNYLYGTVNVSALTDPIGRTGKNRPMNFGTNKCYIDHELINSSTYNANSKEKKATGSHFIVTPTTIEDVITTKTEVIVQPTTTEPGVGKLLCADCGHVINESIEIPVTPFVFKEITDVRSIHTDKQKEYAKGDYRTLPEGIKGSGDNSRPNPVVLSVKDSPLYNKNDVTQYTLKLYKGANFEEYKEFTSTTGDFTLENLNINTCYYYTYTAQVGQTSYESELDGFYVEDEAPRNIYIDGTDNARDIGGWPIDGEPNKRIPQNLIYRSANLDSITAKGRQQIADLGIKTEIDIRLPEDTTKHSIIDGVTYYNFGMNNTSAYGSNVTKESIKNAMKIFANPDNYPILFHCTAGADRTGFMSYFLNSLAGGTQESRYKDYMFTNFGNHGSRVLDNIIGYHTGSSLESFLLEIGVTQTEIDSIKSILAPVDNQPFDGHNNTGEWESVDETYHHIVCDECGQSLVKDKHHFSSPYTKEGVTDKHFVTCEDCGYEKAVDHKLVFKEFVTEPTATSAGLAKVICEDCGEGEQTISLPAVTENDYDIFESAGLFDGDVGKGTQYTLKDTTYGEISGFLTFDIISNYIKIGDTYMTPTIWNNTFPNAVAEESGLSDAKVLTLTVTGSQDVELNNYLPTTPGKSNGMDLTTYSKVVVTGTGTLNIKFIGGSSTPCAGISANDFEIDENTTLSMSGMYRGSTSDAKYYYALSTTGTVDVKGTFNISKFGSGICVANGVTGGATVNIEDTGSVTMTGVTNGIHNLSPLTFTNEGYLNIRTDNTGGTSWSGIYCENEATLNFVGESETIINGGYGIRMATNNRLDVFIRDSSKFTSTSYSTSLLNYTTFVVGNGSDGSTKCSAKVSMTVSYLQVLIAKPVENAQSLTIFNSSETSTLKKSSTAATAIKFDGGTNCIKFLSNVNFVNMATLFEFTNNPNFPADSFIIRDSEENLMINVDSSFKNFSTGTYTGTIPTNPF